ncbi:MAG: hypothetical protein K8R92_03910 [Planctomycetes bacterium]|nr:hypothetical protein [Planctomycetota bacterium]
MLAQSAFADAAGDNWAALAKSWASSAGAARCKVTVAVQDGDLASERNAEASVIAWDASDRKFALEQDNLTVLVDPKRMRGIHKEMDAAVDRDAGTDPAVTFRQAIPESPWPQLGLALRGPSEDWWKAIDPELGVVALKSFVKKDDGTIIVLLAGSNGTLELTFVGESTHALRAATRRIESGPRVPKNAALEWRMTFDPIEIPAGMLSLDVGDRRRVERLDDLQPQAKPMETPNAAERLKPKPPDSAKPKPDEPSTIPVP